MSDIDICPFSSEHSDPAFALTSRVFVDTSVLHKTVGVSIEEYRQYLRGSFDAMQEQQLSLLATDSKTKEIIGCLIACDYASQTQNGSQAPDSLKPINALLRSLDHHYRETRRAVAGQCMLVDMAVVSPDASGRGIYQSLREAAHVVGKNAGFKRVVGELSSAATQHVCVNKLGHRVCAEIEYASFEYAGRRPFAAIQEPRSIQLVEAELF